MCFVPLIFILDFVRISTLVPVCLFFHIDAAFFILLMFWSNFDLILYTLCHNGPDINLFDFINDF